MTTTKLKPKEQYALFKQEIQLCINIKTIDASLFRDEREKLTQRGLCFIERGFYAPAVAKEMKRLFEE